MQSGVMNAFEFYWLVPLGLSCLLPSVECFQKIGMILEDFKHGQ